MIGGMGDPWAQLRKVWFTPGTVTEGIVTSRNCHRRDGDSWHSYGIGNGIYPWNSYGGGIVHPRNCHRRDGGLLGL